MKNTEVFEDCISLLVEHLQQAQTPCDIIVGLDARGFIFGPLMAQRMGVPFVPIRKAGKLPGETVQHSYSLEYGTVSLVYPDFNESSLWSSVLLLVVYSLFSVLFLGQM